MADIYEMHTCGDTVADAQKDADALKDQLVTAHELAINATHILHGLDDSGQNINDAEIRLPLLNASRYLAGLIRPFKDANMLGDQAQIALDDYLATVEEGTTNAHKVKHIEQLQERCNEVAGEMKTAGAAIEAY
jgi:hypothetical protein